jgi:hypothetical protein
MLRPSKDDEALLAQLESDHLLVRSGGAYRTARRWQGAMARAALCLYASGDEGNDLRVPIAFALVELYGPDTPTERLEQMVELMLPIESRSLGNLASAAPG